MPFSLQTSRMIVAFLTCAAIASIAYGGISDKCLGCICRVESGCRPVGCKWDVTSYSCGYFQIKYGYWQDCGRPGSGWKECANDYNCAAGCVRAYMNRYIGSSGCPANCESYARIHNGGPRGCRNPNTVSYWNRVQQQGCTPYSQSLDFVPRRLASYVSWKYLYTKK
ncbi:lysozyme-like [Saccostrea echinata]|uniref:lysozyme-like n=1 Tax=Saccostrea echinata TaxID=191078 RepID=UPI002A801722|nr:lysozyme-like [Saccostrea echinata]